MKENVMEFENNCIHKFNRLTLLTHIRLCSILHHFSIVFDSQIDKVDSHINNINHFHKFFSVIKRSNTPTKFVLIDREFLGIVCHSYQQWIYAKF